MRRAPFRKRLRSLYYEKQVKVKYSPGIRKTPETIQISEALVRETGLEELEKRPYRTLSSLFVKNSFPYETSLYIPS
jgi:hypothetical protein